MLNRLLLCGLLCLPVFGCGGAGYTYCQPITMDHTQAGTADTPNFVLWTFDSDLHWATVANGGVIQHTASQTGGGAAITVPADAIFTSDSACATKLKWEFEDYTSTTGGRDVWIQIPTLSHTVDTVIYECLGNASVTTWQGDVTGTWDSTIYVMVQHLPSITTISDSSLQANSCTNVSTISAAGRIGNGAQGSGTGQWINCGHTSFPTGASALTTEVWWNETGGFTGNHIITNFGDATVVNKSDVLLTNLDQVKMGGAGNTLSLAGIVPGTWYFGSLTYDGTTQAAYLNGASFGSSATAYNISFGGLAVTRIFDDGFSETFNGKIDEVRHLKVAATPSRILADYNSTKPGTNFYSLPSTANTKRRILAFKFDVDKFIIGLDIQ